MKLYDNKYTFVKALGYGGFVSTWKEKAISNLTNKKMCYFFTNYRKMQNILPNLLKNKLNLEEVFNRIYNGFLYEKDRRLEDTSLKVLVINSDLC